MEAPAKYPVAHYQALNTMEGLSLQRVRQIAALVPDVLEFHLNDLLKVVSFKNFPQNCRIDVYYASGTVSTCLFHPVSGKTQLFRRIVDLAMLQEMFLFPRTYPGQSFQALGTTPDIFDSTNILSEEDALREKLALLEPQLQLIQGRVAELERQRLTNVRPPPPPAPTWTSPFVTARMTQVSETPTVAARASGPPVTTHPPHSPHPPHPPPLNVPGMPIPLGDLPVLPGSFATNDPPVAPSNIALEIQAPRPNSGKKGDSSSQCGAQLYRDSKVQHQQLQLQTQQAQPPQAVCVALCGKGRVRITGTGQVKIVNLSTELTEKLSVIPENAQDRIEYVALGEHGQYYVRKFNGKAIYSGGTEFNLAMAACLSSGLRPEFVSFGPPNTYYARLQDGTIRYSRNLEQLLPAEIFQMVVHENSVPTIRHVSLGSYLFIDESRFVCCSERRKLATKEYRTVWKWDYTRDIGRS